MPEPFKVNMTDKVVVVTGAATAPGHENLSGKYFDGRKEIQFEQEGSTR